MIFNVFLWWIRCLTTESQLETLVHSLIISSKVTLMMKNHPTIHATHLDSLLHIVFHYCCPLFQLNAFFSPKIYFVGVSIWILHLLFVNLINESMEDYVIETKSLEDQNILKLLLWQNLLWKVFLFKVN